MKNVITKAVRYYTNIRILFVLCFLPVLSAYERACANAGYAFCG
jgi:hypothetical protein